MVYRAFVTVLGMALFFSQESLKRITVIDVPGPKGQRFDYLTIDGEDHYLLSAHLGPGILYVVDMRTHKVVKAIPALPGITGLEYVPGLHKVYTSDWGEEKIGVVDLRTMSVIKRLPTESKPNGMAYAESFRKVYVVNTLGKAVSVINVDKDEIVKILRFDSETGTPGYDAVATRIYVTLRSTNEVAEISTLFFDNNGNAVPVPPPTTAPNYRNKFAGLVNSHLWLCNSAPHRLLSYTVSPENDVLPPGTPLQRISRPLPRLDSVWNTGSHMTHLLNSNGELVEYRAQFQTQLNQLLSEQGFPEPTTGLLTERSAIRKVSDSWKPAKIYIGAINQAHSLFVAGELDLEGYSSKLAVLLDPEGRTDVYGFLATIADSLADRTYCSESKFGAKLKKDFITFRDDGGSVADAEDEDSEDGNHPARDARVCEASESDWGGRTLATTRTGCAARQPVCDAVL